MPDPSRSISRTASSSVTLRIPGPLYPPSRASTASGPMTAIDFDAANERQDAALVLEQDEGLRGRLSGQGPMVGVTVQPFRLGRIDEGVLE